ncbi:hypothetical protein DNTS_022018, partial [Danionella cerebrum]
ESRRVMTKMMRMVVLMMKVYLNDLLTTSAAQDTEWHTLRESNESINSPGIIMGSSSSSYAPKTIYLDVDGKLQRVIFSRHCSPCDIKDLLCSSSNIPRNSAILLIDSEGALISIDPTMPPNTPKEGRHVPECLVTGGRAVQQLKIEVTNRLAMLEKRVELEGLKVVEIEKCKNDLKKLRDEMTSRGGVRVNCNCKYNFADDGKKLSPRRDVPSYPKYTLSQETIEALKKPTFDVWHWEHNELEPTSNRTSAQTSNKEAILMGHEVEEHIQRDTVCLGPLGLANPASLTAWMDGCSGSIADNQDLNFFLKLYHCRVFLASSSPLFHPLRFHQACLGQSSPLCPKESPPPAIHHWTIPLDLWPLVELRHPRPTCFLVDPGACFLLLWSIASSGLAIQENYRDNPFHNFRHCFCVSQMMYGMIHLCGLQVSDYQINARTELAVRYNDISPLENHHCAVTFQILSMPECNIFANIEPDSFKQMRQAIITLILATDMARHGEILDSFKQKVDNFDFTNEEHVKCLKMVLIKCCDISNEVRPTEVAEPWVDCLLEEYFMQSDREKSEGLPVAPFMDRDKVTKPTAQIGFIKFVLIPMFETVMKLFPQIEEIMVQPLRDSRDHYEELKQIDDAMSEAQKKKTESMSLGGKKK